MAARNLIPLALVGGAAYLLWKSGGLSSLTSPPSPGSSQSAYSPREFAGAGSPGGGGFVFYPFNDGQHVTPPPLDETTQPPPPAPGGSYWNRFKESVIAPENLGFVATIGAAGAGAAAARRIFSRPPTPPTPPQAPPAQPAPPQAAPKPGPKQTTFTRWTKAGGKVGGWGTAVLGIPAVAIRNVQQAFAPGPSGGAGYSV